MRDVSHQADGAHVLGLAAFNRNMLGKFARGISPSRDFCSYWEIDKWNRPAPVDYRNDRDFWYNLPANFDVLDACRRQYLWTGDRAYLEDPAFLEFYRLTVDDYIKAWDKDGDGVPEHRPDYGNRGLGGYDEGPFSERTLFGADLVAVTARALDSYAQMAGWIGGRGKAEASALRERAAALRGRFDAEWWNASRGQYADFALVDGRLAFEDQFWSGVFPLYFGLLPPGPRREATLRRILDREPEGIEVESYLPEIYYRYGADEAAYAEILALTDPAKKRREYPEVPFAVIGAVATGLIGLEPNADSEAFRSLSRLTPKTPWAELRHVPIGGAVIDIRHDGRHRTSLAVRSGRMINWKAAFDGVWDELIVDGAARRALHGQDESGRPISWALLSGLHAGDHATVATPARR